MKLTHWCPAQIYYYYDEEYPFLEEEALRRVKSRFPNIEFPEKG